MRVLLAFALLLGLSLTATASAAETPSAPECVVAGASYDVGSLLDASEPAGAETAVFSVTEVPTAVQAREPECYLVIIDWYDGDGNYIGSEVGILCFGE